MICAHMWMPSPSAAARWPQASGPDTPLPSGSCATDRRWPSWRWEKGPGHSWWCTLARESSFSLEGMLATNATEPSRKEGKPRGYRMTQQSCQTMDHVFNTNIPIQNLVYTDTQRFVVDLKFKLNRAFCFCYWQFFTWKALGLIQVGPDSRIPSKFSLQRVGHLCWITSLQGDLPFPSNSSGNHAGASVCLFHLATLWLSRVEHVNTGVKTWTTSSHYR